MTPSISPSKRTILAAVQAHPMGMSAVLLEYLLRGERVGRMAEKGLLDSEYHGALKDLPGAEIAYLISDALGERLLLRTAGFYPALALSPLGALHLSGEVEHVHERSPAKAFQAYHRWRRDLARSLRKPPYRILSNELLNHLAIRQPTNLEDLLSVPGLGKRRAMRYRESLLALGRQMSGEDEGKEGPQAPHHAA